MNAEIFFVNLYTIVYKLTKGEIAERASVKFKAGAVKIIKKI
jgi:hypothetical protein